MNNIELDDAWHNPPPYPNIQPISRSSFTRKCKYGLVGLLIGLLIGLSGIIFTIFYISSEYKTSCQPTMEPGQPTSQPTMEPGQPTSQPTKEPTMEPTKNKKYIIDVPHSTLLTDDLNAHTIMTRGDYMYEEYTQFKKKYVAETQISKLINDFMVDEMMFIFNMNYISRKNSVRYVNLLNYMVSYTNTNPRFPGEVFKNFSFEVENSTEKYYYKSINSVASGYPNIKYNNLFTITGHYAMKIFRYNDDKRGNLRPIDDCAPFGGWKCFLYVYQIET